MNSNLFSTALCGLLTVAAPAAAADQHLVIVSIGDSLAAGEGNPNSFSLTTGASWSNAPCHRSMLNGRRVASNRINSMDGVSTTFFDFACSGAGIDNLISVPQLIDQPDAPNAPNRPPQIDQVVDALGKVPGTNRTDAVIDALFISIGVNDVNFKNVVQECLTDPFDCSTSPQVGVAMGDVSGLAVKYQNLVNAVHTRLPHTKHVYITEYPNEMASRPGDFCGDLDDGTGDPSMALVSATENQFLFTNLLSKLNDQVENAASIDPIWRFVQGPQDTFATHGYCTPLARRYVNTALDSVTRQGNQNGTMHPNVAGHKAYADALIARVTPDFNLPLENPRVIRTAEINNGMPCDLNPVNLVNCAALPLVPKTVQVEIAQIPATLTVTLQHRVLTDPFCVPFVGCTTPTVPPFANAATTDAGAGRLNLFQATIPGSENLAPNQTVQYQFVITATRNSETKTIITPRGTIRLGEPLVGTFFVP